MLQDVEAFAAHLPNDALRHPRAEHMVAGVRVAEGGPLTECSGKRTHTIAASTCRSKP